MHPAWLLDISSAVFGCLYILDICKDLFIVLPMFMVIAYCGTSINRSVHTNLLYPMCYCNRIYIFYVSPSSIIRTLLYEPVAIQTCKLKILFIIKMSLFYTTVDMTRKSYMFWNQGGNCSYSSRDCIDWLSLKVLWELMGGYINP